MTNWMLSRWILMAVALMGPAMGLAQFSTGGETPSKPAWQQFKLDPKKRISLSFRNANVDMVLDVISRASGITIVKDPTLKEPITVASPKAVSLDEAFQILNAALSVRNFEMRKEGNILVIAARRQNQGRDGGQGGFGGMTREQIEAMMGGGQRDNPNELKVYRVKFANASEVARVVNEVFIQQQMQQNPMAMFQQMQQGGRNQGGRGGGNQRFGGFGGATGQQPAVRASSDDFSNTVIVNAPRSQQRDVEALIKEIDQQTEQPQKAKVYQLEFAVAADLAAVVQNVLTSNAPTGRGGTGQQNVPLSQRFQQAARFGSMQAGFGTVVADSRTNSLIVTATDENQVLVGNVIKELDQEITLENTTFVFPLSNARADQVGNLLNQAFGGRTTGGTNRNTGTLNNRNQNANRNNQRQGGGGGGGGGLGGNTGRGVPDPTSLPVEFEDPDAETGELYTQVRIGAQGGGFGGQGFGGGQNRQNQGTSGLARGADGRLVNVRDLSGQVTVISDPNTNSLIVVTAPDNVELIKQILDQLDRIPEQVMIETMIVEATLDKSMKLGVEWNFVQEKAFGSTGVTGNAGQGFGLANTLPPLEGFRYTLNGGNLSTFVNALQKDDRFQVLSTPRIFTSNNVEAEINISQSVPYVLSTREDANGNLTFNYAFQDVGIVLTVTPQITSNGYVTLDVSQTANDLQGFTSFNAPIVNQRQAQTTVSVMDGETVILGGIMRSTVSSKVKKLPLLGDIPILGELFKTTERQNVKTELLVFLTPRVVRNPGEAAKLREEQENRLSPGVRKVVDSERPKPAAAVGKGKKGNQIGPAPSPAQKKTSKIGG